MSRYASTIPGGNADGANLLAACPECDRLRAEVDQMKRDLSGVTDECANLLRIKARLEAEVERLKGERDGYSWAAKDLADALRYTQEYVGSETLPAFPGWSWHDALTRYESADAAHKAREFPMPERLRSCPVTGAGLPSADDGQHRVCNDPRHSVPCCWDCCVLCHDTCPEPIARKAGEE